MVKRRMEYENRFLAAVLYLALIETCAFAGQWDFMSVWHEVSEGATGTTADWFDSNNWGIQDNGFGFGPRVPDWTVCAAIQPRPPDCCISMSSPYYYGPDAYGYDAACSNLQVHPWSWAGISVNGMTVTDGKINCGWKIGVCAYNQFPSDTSGYGVLDVNGGQLYTPGLRNFDANDPYDPCKFDDPAAPWIEGQGLWIGGGFNGIGSNYGIVNIRSDGQIIVPAIKIYYGVVNLYGGLLYDNNDSPENFFISLSRYSTNRINIAGGELRLKGDRRTQVEFYVNFMRGRRNNPYIVPYGGRGMLFIDFNGTDTSVTAEYNPANAWAPSPASGAQNVSVNPALSWQPGQWVQNPGLGGRHAVYFGTDYSEVLNATTATPDIYRGRQDPCTFTLSGLLADTNYYWRIDEFNDANVDSPWTGWIWHFKTQGAVAVNPNPANGTVGLTMPLQLSWAPGVFASSNELYIGTSEVNVTDSRLFMILPDVTEVNVSDSVFPLGNLPFDLAKDTNYYWRVDEVNYTTGTRWMGDVWMFRNTDYFVIDDFNSYQSSQDMYNKWVTNYYIPGLDVYARAGLSWNNDYDRGALQFYYNNTTDPCFSEASFITNGGQGADWTGGGALPANDPIVSIAVSYFGAAANSADPVYDRMYMALEDTDGDFNFVLNPDPNAARNFYQWNQWNVRLSDLGMGTSINLASVDYFYLGFGQWEILYPGGTGTVLFDDLRLYQRHCVPDLNRPSGDFTGDCRVDISDLDYLAGDWLLRDTVYVLPMTTPVNDYVVRYNFDESSGTVAFNAVGDGDDAIILNPINDALMWNTAGGYNGGGCLNLRMNSRTFVEVPPAVLDFLSNQRAMTMMLWINMDYYSPPDQNTHLISIWEPNASDINVETVQIECPTTRPPADDSGPKVRIKWTGVDSGICDDNYSPLMRLENFASGWNHFAFVKDADANTMKVYHNGFLVVEANGNVVPMPTPPLSALRIGAGENTESAKYWVGSIDDFRIYDRAVPASEIAFIGTQGTGLYIIPIDSSANIADGPPYTISFKDFAIMAQQWLTQTAWP